MSTVERMKIKRLKSEVETKLLTARVEVLFALFRRLRLAATQSQ